MERVFDDLAKLNTSRYNAQLQLLQRGQLQALESEFKILSYSINGYAEILGNIRAGFSGNRPLKLGQIGSRQRLQEDRQRQVALGLSVTASPDDFNFVEGVSRACGVEQPYLVQERLGALILADNIARASLQGC